MSFKNLSLDICYSSEINNKILDEFYKPLFSEAVKYHRAVGYFSCQSLVMALNGVDVDNLDLDIVLVISPELSEQDILDIEEGYKCRTEIIEKSIINKINEESNVIDISKLSVVGKLIANNKLDILVATPRNNDGGIYHEKYGIFYDSEDNRVAFVGSLNETYSGLMRNYESFDVYFSWEYRDNIRINHKISEFQKLVNNDNNSLCITTFPIAAKNRILKLCSINTVQDSNIRISIPKYIDNKPFEVRQYQIDAVEAWKKNDYKGLFTMATGTGKTHTSLYASVCLFDLEKLNSLLTIVVCPYKHLIDQWEEDAVQYNYEIVKVSSDFDWEYNLKMRIRNLKSEVISSLMVIVSNDTFIGEKFQKTIRKYDTNVLLIIDEAHNFGTEKKFNSLDEYFIYRIALSATPIRHFDESGTNRLIEYFHGEIFKFTLKEAINKGFLTKYYYYPIIVSLRDEEFDRYYEISKEIIPFFNAEKRTIENDYVKMRLIERSRIITLAKNKESELLKIMKKYSDQFNNIVYCGAGTNDLYDAEVSQIDSVSKILGFELNMKCHQFTFNEPYSLRKELIHQFQKKELQALVAIKCLDEGVNIPSIERAFILSSSTNPKEYIQRRGRVLRKFPGKEYAYIYDFVTLPRQLNEVRLMDNAFLSLEKSIVRREIRRLLEFAELAENSFDTMETIINIANAFRIDLKEELFNGEQ